MTVLDAIRQVDGLRHNTFSQEEKVRWLSRLDSMIHREILATHQGAAAFAPYGEAVPLDTALLVPEPYEELYLYWLEAQIHYHNGEYGKYNQAYAMYSAALKAFANQYNRTHMPNGTSYQYF